MRFPLLTKVLAIGLVMLLLSLVLMRIDGLVDERRARQSEARSSIEQSLAGSQTLLGPLLHRRCSEEWEAVVGEGKDARKTTQRRDIFLAAVPQELQLHGDMVTQQRHRGLFKLNAWAGTFTLQAQFTDLAALRPRAEHAPSRLACEAPLLMLAVSDVRGLRVAQVRIDGQAGDVQPGTEHPRFDRGLHVALPPGRIDGNAAAPIAIGMTLELIGSSRFALVPAARATTLTLNSDWPHPSFGGRFLPDTREIHERGFTARWAISSLASSAALDVLRNGETCTLRAADRDDDGGIVTAVPSSKERSCLDTLAVALIDPVNPYVLTDRAIKYALLFVVLTFLSVALTEVLSRRSVHPVQYTLVGLALALFYLLLLSLSEHVAFGTAYAAASAGCVLLLGFYARHMLGSLRAGLAFGAGIALLYGALWALLQMEQTALVIGSLLLFGALAAVMVLTRRLDWYNVFASLRRDAAAAK